MELLCFEKAGQNRVLRENINFCNLAREALFYSVVGAGVDGAIDFLEHLSFPECLK